jgi:two-component system, cell cycle sensor histidine kinase and response regulator CckA
MQEREIIGALQREVQEMAIRVRHLEKECLLAREEYEESTAKYLEVMDVLRVKNDELKSIKENLESIILERTKQLQETVEALKAESAKSRKAVQELRDHEKILLQAEKMKAIGTLAGGIAHDFNNLLTGIQGYTSIMLLELDETHPHYLKLRNIEDFVRSGATLTKQLLDFAREGTCETKAIDLNSVIEKTASMFGRTKKDIAVYKHLQEGLWTVEVDPGKIEQVLVNLFLNAGQAMPMGGELNLASCNVMIDENYRKSYRTSPGPYVKISVTDTGVGMKEDVKERIFEPFFTTKEMGRGAGLGLASVYGIIKSHGGMINVYSEMNHGTTISFYLPASMKEAEKEKIPQTTPVTGKETILLVDDEKMILDVGCEILEMLGYHVLAANSGSDAVQIYEREKERIDLVILDMIMPGMSGGETFDCIRTINPGAAVILSSGYSISGEARKIMERGCRAFVQKPYTIGELSLKIRESIGKRE